MLLYGGGPHFVNPGPGSLIPLPPVLPAQGPAYFGNMLLGVGGGKTERIGSVAEWFKAPLLR